MAQSIVTKKEMLLVVRDSSGKIVAVINRIEGQQKYEIYTTMIADIDEIEKLLSSDNKI